MNYEAREELGLLYSVVCENCGWFWDDHDNPDYYGHQHDEEPRIGFSTALLNCHEFTIAQESIEETALVSAKRIFWEQHPIYEFLHNPQISKRVDELLLEKEDDWTQERDNYLEQHKYAHIGPCTLYVIPFPEGSVVAVGE